MQHVYEQALRLVVESAAPPDGTSAAAAAEQAAAVEQVDVTFNMGSCQDSDITSLNSYCPAGSVSGLSAATAAPDTPPVAADVTPMKSVPAVGAGHTPRL